MTASIFPFSNRIIRVAFWLPMFGSLSSALGAVAPADRQIEQLVSAISRVDNLAWIATESTVVKRLPSANSYQKNRRLRTAKNGHRWACTVKETGQAWYGSDVHPASQWQEIVFRDDFKIQINLVDGAILKHQFSSPGDVPGPTASEQMWITGSLDTKPPLESINPHHYLECGAVLLGYLDNRSYLPSLLAGGHIDAAPPSPSIPGCIVVSAKSAQGLCRAWLDPSRDCLPRHVEVEKTGSDLLGGVAIDKRPVAKAGKIWPTSRLVAYRHTIHDITYTVFRGFPIINRLSETRLFQYADGQSVAFETEFSAEDFRATTDDDFSPSVSIPDGTKVSVPRSAPIRYMWAKGAMVPDTTPVALSRLERIAQGQTVESTSWTSYILVMLNVLVITTLLFWAVARRRKWQRDS